MISLLPNLPENVVGVAAAGRVEAADYDTVIVPAIEAALSRHKKVRLLYVLTDEFEGFAPGAMWEDMKLGFAHLTAWEKAAFVTDVQWVTNAANMFNFVIPCEVRVFALKDRAQAEAWLIA